MGFIRNTTVMSEYGPALSCREPRNGDVIECWYDMRVKQWVNQYGRANEREDLPLGPAGPYAEAVEKAGLAGYVRLRACWACGAPFKPICDYCKATNA